LNPLGVRWNRRGGPHFTSSISFPTTTAGTLGVMAYPFFANVVGMLEQQPVGWSDVATSVPSASGTRRKGAGALRPHKPIVHTTALIARLTDGAGIVRGKSPGVKFGLKSIVDRQKVLRAQEIGTSDIAKQLSIGRSTVYKIINHPWRSTARLRSKLCFPKLTWIGYNTFQ
jgi:hypothetical protein